MYGSLSKSHEAFYFSECKTPFTWYRILLVTSSNIGTVRPFFLRGEARVEQEGGARGEQGGEQGEEQGWSKGGSKDICMTSVKASMDKFEQESH